MLDLMIKPMLCKTAEVGLLRYLDDLESREWIVEEKLDGERVIMFIDFRKPYFRIQNRYQFDKTKVYPEFNLNSIRQLFSQDVNSCVLDGEVIAVSKNFNDFQRRSHLSNSFKISIMRDRVPLKFVVFDVLMFNGVSLVNSPLRSRKEVLKKILISQNNIVETSQIIVENLKKFFEEVVKNGEGVVCKKVSSPYEMGNRSGNWLKIKKKATETFKVLDWNERSGRGNYGSLKTTNGDVGLLNKSNKEEYDRLVKEVGLDKIWVEAEFQEKTKAGKLRFPIFKRLIVR